MTLGQLHRIFASQVGKPEIYYMIQTATGVSVCKHKMSSHKLGELLPTLKDLTYDHTQGTYPLFKEAIV